MRITFDIHATAEGTLDEIAPDALQLTKQVHPTLAQVLAQMATLCFTVETMAHLGGKERELLPQCDAARKMIADLQPRER